MLSHKDAKQYSFWFFGLLHYMGTQTTRNKWLFFVATNPHTDILIYKAWSFREYLIVGIPGQG